MKCPFVVLASPVNRLLVTPLTDLIFTELLLAFSIAEVSELGLWDFPAFEALGFLRIGRVEELQLAPMKNTPLVAFLLALPPLRSYLMDAAITHPEMAGLVTTKEQKLLIIGFLAVEAIEENLGFFIVVFKKSIGDEFGQFYGSDILRVNQPELFVGQENCVTVEWAYDLVPSWLVGMAPQADTHLALPGQPSGVLPQILLTLPVELSVFEAVVVFKTSQIEEVKLAVLLLIIIDLQNHCLLVYWAEYLILRTLLD